MRNKLCHGLVPAILSIAFTVNSHNGAFPPQLIRVSQLIRQLGHEDYDLREAASRELIEIGEPALPELQSAAATNADPEVRWRAEQIAQTVVGRIRAATTKKALEALQGTWYLVSYEVDGKQIRGEDKTFIFTVKEDKWSSQVGGQLAQAGTIASIEVKEGFSLIDLPITQGGNIGVTATSIYAIEGNTLKYLNSAAPRATEFITRPGDGRNYLIYRRANAEP